MRYILIGRGRWGVGEKPPRMDLADYVLGHFSAEEREVMNEGARTATLAIEKVIAEGPDAAMNKYNARKKPSKKDSEDEA